MGRGWKLVSGKAILNAPQGYRWEVYGGRKTLKSGTAPTWDEANDDAEEAIEELEASYKGEEE